MALHVLDEANRCLGCKKPMCQQGCPIHTNIPEVIRLLKANQMDDAGRMLFENNPLTTVCSLVCNHENQCEGHCIRNRMPSHDPVHFSIIEDYISTTYANKPPIPAMFWDGMTVPGPISTHTRQVRSPKCPTPSPIRHKIPPCIWHVPSRNGVHPNTVTDTSAVIRTAIIRCTTTT